MNWRNDKITDKQIAYISDMQEFSNYPLPKFKGKTKGEAADYINNYHRLAHESIWAIENGY